MSFRRPRIGRRGGVGLGGGVVNRCIFGKHLIVLLENSYVIPSTTNHSNSNFFFKY